VKLRPRVTLPGSLPMRGPRRPRSERASEGRSVGNRRDRGVCHFGATSRVHSRSDSEGSAICAPVTQTRPHLSVRVHLATCSLRRVPDLRSGKPGVACSAPAGPNRAYNVREVVRWRLNAGELNPTLPVPGSTDRMDGSCCMRAAGAVD
jgi:hypothetical protein